MGLSQVPASLRIPPCSRRGRGAEPRPLPSLPIAARGCRGMIPPQTVGAGVLQRLFRGRRPDVSAPGLCSRGQEGARRTSRCPDSWGLLPEQGPMLLPPRPSALAALGRPWLVSELSNVSRPGSSCLGKRDPLVRGGWEGCAEPAEPPPQGRSCPQLPHCCKTHAWGGGNHA